MYDFLMYIDVDEIIVPTKNESFLMMLKRLSLKYANAASFKFNVSWHFEDHQVDTQVPSYLHMQVCGILGGLISL